MKLARFVLQLCRRLEGNKPRGLIMGPIPVYPGNEVMHRR